ncbi:NAD(P)/FAD-dependent oxidoreductase [Fluviispira sanaruensis]|uniref:Ferredoxin--NADP reductase n=1 Tax=Fluviispira sanaruensis TaxID=2493639 RepID=A0A4V0P2E4_FLUSA|nr:NAD(P)/FAD-dependent oxidoreductase [Fluviispira sanaruensis]BBH52937.1 NAD(P)/FAD-dependent oxidoreductase [Fluviispira sanaruensis]
MNAGLLDCYDTIIIGGGPVGLFGAYYAGLRDMSVRLVDRRHELGGQLTAIYPEKWVYDMTGIPAIRGKELYKNLVEQTAPYNIPSSLNEEVVLIRKNRNNILCIETRKGTVMHSKTAILCLGMGAHIPRRLDIQNLREFEGKGIHYGVHSLETFRNKRVIVVGGGDSALDLALTIVNDCKDLYVLHRSDRFNAHEETTKKLYASDAEIRTFSELSAIEGNENHLTSATIKNTKTGETTTIEIDEVIIAVGLLFNLEVVQQWGIAMEGNSIIVDHNRQTSIPGIYAAGDIVTYPGKMKLIGTGTAEAMQGINHAKGYIQEKFPYL